MNVKVFNLMSGVNKTRFLVQHESCECKCGSNESVCNSKQKLNHNGYWRDCKKLDDWSSWENDLMWNPSTSDCECNKACTIDKYLDSKNCSCEERQISKLVLECKDEMLKTTETLLDDKKKTRKKNCLIHTISLAIICLSL